MTKKKEHVIFFGRTEEGTFIASSATSPYFLFEGDTEEDVREIVCRALNFYFGADGKIKTIDQPKPRSQTKLSRVFRQKSEVISISDLAVA